MPSAEILPTANALRIPSGYEDVRGAGVATVGPDVLPWLDGPRELNLTECTLQGGSTFYLASAIKTHDKLSDAARRMNDHQRRNTDNMFYSRLPGLVENGHASRIEVLNDPSINSTVYVMRNDGGQRVYFTRVDLPGQDGSTKHVIMRLAACDKNRQDSVMSVLSGGSEKYTRRKMRK